MLKQGFAKTFDNNAEYDILRKKDNSKTKDKIIKAKEATSSASNPMPDPDDFEPGKYKKKDDKSSEEKFKWEVKEQNSADKISRHKQFGNFYRDSEQKIGNKNLWWTKDNAGHGGQSQGLSRPTYKIYEETSNGLQWIADVDEIGNVISKNKGPIGQRINWKDLIGIK